MMVSFYKDANQERKFLGLTLSPNKHRLKEYINSQSEDFESEMINRRKNIKNDWFTIILYAKFELSEVFTINSFEAETHMCFSLNYYFKKYLN